MLHDLITIYGTINITTILLRIYITVILLTTDIVRIWGSGPALAICRMFDTARF